MAGKRSPSYGWQDSSSIGREQRLASRAYVRRETPVPTSHRAVVSSLPAPSRAHPSIASYGVEDARVRSCRSSIARLNESRSAPRARFLERPRIGMRIAHCHRSAIASS